MKKLVLGMLGFTILAASISHANSGSGTEVFAGKYSLVAGDQENCSKQLEVKVDKNKSISFSDGRIWNISKSECVNVAATEGSSKHTECMSVGNDEVKSSIRVSAPLGEAIVSYGIRYTDLSRTTVTFYREVTNFGSAFVLAKMLQEDPSYSCEYKRN